MKITSKKQVSERSTEFKFDNGAWACLYTDYETEDGSWEYQSDEDEDDDEKYSEGGLWFKGKSLVDYDGCYELPEEVAIALMDLGYDVKDL